MYAGLFVTSRLSFFALLAAAALALTQAASAAPLTQYFGDDFSGSATKRYFFEGELDNRKFRYTDGQYEIDTTGGSSYGQSVLLDDLSEYQLEATGRLSSTTDTNGGGFGLSFNYSASGDSGDFLLFMVYDRGAYTVLRYRGGQTSVLLTPTRTRLFESGQQVTLMVAVNGGAFRCYLNGAEVASLKDDTLTKGGFGMFATAQSVVRFDNLKVLADKAAPAPGFTDSFDSSKRLYEGSWGEVGYRYEGGRYLIDTTGTGYIGLSPFPQPALNFEFSADVELVSGDAVGGFGLYARDYGNASGGFNQFRFLVSGGWFAVEQSVDDRPMALAQWSEHPAVRAGGVNKLTVRAQGGKLTFMVNGQEVYTAADNAPHAGAFGLFASGGIVAAFDNVQFTALP
jgi:hypothetical protein